MTRDHLRQLLRGFATVLFFALFSAHAASKQSLTITSGGIPRDYILVTPDTVPSGPRPLVLVLHGHLGTAANALGGGPVPSPLSEWIDVTDREQILVAALQGLKGADNHTGWHDCRMDATEDPQSDDVGFVQDVVESLIRSGRVDPTRIYVMGMSNGAMMALRLAQQMHPAPAAVAAVSGTMAAQTVCHDPPRRMSVLLIDGTADPIVPYAGGKVGLRGYKTGTVIGAEPSRDYWLAADGLSGAVPQTYDFVHRESSANTSARRYLYGDNSYWQVELITVTGGGHVEPSLKYHYGWLYRQLVGTQNQDFESVEEAWSFFKDKRGPGEQSLATERFGARP